MCLFLSMVVWQPFGPYWRLIIARVSEMHVAYHIGYEACGIFTSAEQTTFNISNNVVILLLLSFLTCIVECVRVCRRRGGNSGYRVRLKIGVRSLLHRKVQCQPTTACCCHVFVPQYGRLAAIYSLLAFNHSACLRNARRIS